VSDNAKGFFRSVRDEITEHVSLKVVELVLEEAPTRKGEFLEVGFRRVVKGLTLNEVEKRRGEPCPHQFSPLADDPENTGDCSAELADRGPGPEEVVQTRERCQLIRAKIGSITDRRHREAVILHHLQGWPITDQDPTTPTLTKHFGVTDRTIRNWMRQALAEIRKALGEEP
jgi:DNA-directed RNA polymerase specialized sigma24 family protein